MCGYTHIYSCYNNHTHIYSYKLYICGYTHIYSVLVCFVIVCFVSLSLALNLSLALSQCSLWLSRSLAASLSRALLFLSPRARVY